MQAAPHRNRLASQSSAYLLQHAANPVDWYPWGDEALELARRLDRPILLSVGYSSCHWCHVMERESFENDEIATLMNAHFVCVKVDREERPDVDHVYMKALQGMTGRGGWPMTMFLTPEGRPFFAGTYFPPEDRAGMPGFPRVLLGVAKAYAEKRDDVVESAQRMVEYLAKEQPQDEEASFTDTTLDEAALDLARSMDREHGGFGNAPKFPGTMALSLMMEADAASGEQRFTDLVRLSLDRMAAGGIRDHLGGGFHRYSVDRTWLVPHFEKMLYDQSLLATLYIDAARCFGDQAYASVAEEIFDYVMREMTAPEGGFFSAQDADSEGVEGKFFVWSRDEVLDVLGTRRGELFCRAYDVTDAGNFEGQAILHRISSELPADPAEREELETDLAVSRGALLERRSRRVAPATDRKIVTDWNSLMISSMASGGELLGRTDLVDVAMRASAFLRSSLMDADGLRHVYAAGAAKIPAFLDDYAFFGRASLDCFAVRPGREHLETALFCADRLLREFQDGERGGFFFTGSRNEVLVARTCDLHDGAVPAGNSVAAELFLRLWSLTGDDAYRRAGEAVLERFLASAIRHPYGGAHLLAVAERHRRGWKTVVVAGDATVCARMSRAARQAYDPGCTVIPVQDQPLEWFPSALAGKTAPPGGALAYICEGVTCGTPISDEEQLRAALHRGTEVGPVAAGGGAG